jgi:membrane peptidoglycan carboxypeptidase
MKKANGKPLDPVPALTLGVNEVSPLDMADALATFAASGKYCPPTVITSVVDTTGRHFTPSPTHCKQAIDSDIANTVTSVLKGVIDGPDPRRTGRGLSIGRPAAGKTGTVQDFADAWFYGYTPQVCAAVFVGDPAGGYGHPLKNVRIGNQSYSRVYGATLPGPIWQDAMKGAVAGMPVKDFPASSSRVAAGKPVPVPDVHGKTVADAERILTLAGFVPNVSPQAVPAGGTPGTVAATNPPAGSKQYLGSSVVIYVTNGQPPPPNLVPFPTATATPSPAPGKPHHTPKPKPTGQGPPPNG